MGQSQANPNMTKKVITKKIDVRDAVDRLDPDRHGEKTEYEFSNGRKFKRSDGEIYS